MAQVLAMDLVHQESLSPLNAKRDSFFSSGRGGSGNIRRSYIASKADLLRLSSYSGRPDLPPLDTIPNFTSAHSGMAADHHEIEKKQLTSSGRGGSGNIQQPTSGLQAHPLTAFILREHDALEAQYEERVRKIHAESNVIRSSGRGGSGNISNPRRRTSAQELRTPSKMHFFTTKGREKRRDTTCDADAATQEHDRQGCTTDKRASRATYSSLGSSELGTIDSASDQRCMSNMSDPSGRENPVTSRTRKRHSLSSLIRISRRSLSSASLTSLPMSPCSPSPSVSTSPQSLHPGIPGSKFRDASSPPPALEEEGGEYVSFLDL